MKKISNKIKRNPRFQAMQTLLEIREGSYANLAVSKVLNQGNLSDLDGGLFTELVYGTVQRKITLEYYLHSFVKNPKKIDAWVEELLKLSIYQMVFLEKIPPHAVLNEAVEIGKNYGNIGIGKFVNGVLRNVQRQGVPETKNIKGKYRRLSVEASIPEDLIKKLEKQYGFQETEELVFSLLKNPKTSARLNVFELSREEAIEELDQTGFSITSSMVSPFGLVSEKGNLSKTSLFERGLLTMQDESSMLVAPTLKIEPHHQVLDACAAPGGKTTHIALFLDSEKGGKVTALDIYEHKIKLIDENVARLKMEDRVETVLGDATEVHQTFPRESFDRILVDAPCSGLGLMRRKPDIKYTKEYQDFSGLQKIQLDILESVSTCLKKNGIITYSTCTILEEENQVVVNKFLSKHPEFVLEEVFVPKSVQKLVKDGVVQILPHHFSTDGFFISCLRKQK